jgi:CrcB protein
MHALILIFIGGGLGSVLRFVLSAWVMSRLGPAFPYGTLAVNALGCMLIGLLSGLPSGLLSLSPAMRLACVTGFLGGLTTFSAYEYESFRLAMDGAPLKALLNLVLSVLVGLAALLAGYALTRTALGAR